MSSAILTAEDLCYSYPGRHCPVFASVNLVAHEGERVALVGPSGSGKTTLLRLLDGSLKPTSGRIRAEGDAALVYQDLRLVGEDTVFNNIASGAMREQKWGFSPAAQRRTRELIEEIGLEGLENARVSELSGGQQKRVAIARALCMKPRLLLADEPFANLDEAGAKRIAALLIRLQERYGFALICSAHDVFKVPGFFTRETSMSDCACELSQSLQSLVDERRIRDRQRTAKRQWTGGILAAVALLAVAIWMQLFRGAPTLPSAAQEIGKVLRAMVPTSFLQIQSLPWASLLAALWQTVQMAFLGTVIGVLVSAPLAILGALPGKASFFSRAARGVGNVIRAVPSLLWALLFVAALGIGPVAGVTALAAYSVGYLSRLFMDELEGVDTKPTMALMQMGASRLQAMHRTVLRPALPGLSSSALFVFEYNVRGASLLGLVGAGGIGSQIHYYAEWRRFPELGAALLLIVLVAVALDAASRKTRQSLLRARGS